MAWRSRASMAALVSGGAFALYWSTLLPGFDFGDTASFQVMAGSAAITPRDGYPLYFAVTSLFTALTTGDAAYAMNLASAAAGAAGCGLIVLLAGELSGSLPAAVAAAAVFAGSYTFWSQSVIAEVYALHICLIATALLLLLRWERRPELGRLALFFGAYALAFGNHLSTILLLPGCALFLMIAAPGGWRSVASPRVIGMAISIAAVASLQYWWNLRTLWVLPQPPATVLDGLKTFWFDVTKSDWRDTMVLEVPWSMTLERARMYAFDVAQQFGWFFPAVALAGVYRLSRKNWKRAALIGTVYAVNAGFALGYSVGDSHVFFLPSHLIIALLIAPGLLLFDEVTSRRGMPRGAVTLLALTVAGIHVYRDYPALDRSADLRPRQSLDSLAQGLNDQNALLLTDLNWQVQNGLTYYAGRTRSDLAVARLPEILSYAPALIGDNAAIDRSVVVAGRARDQLAASFGPWFSTTPDPRAAARALSDTVRAVPDGTRYVLCVLRPTREFVLDQDDLRRSVQLLTGGHSSALPGGDYVAMTGVVGHEPAAVIAGSRPFREAVNVEGIRVELRMESWLAFDTIRRMGFGHVVAARRHTMIVERGVSFATFDDDGRAVQTAYAANIFEPQWRWLVTAR